MVTLSLNSVITAHVTSVFGEGSSFLGRSQPCNEGLPSSNSASVSWEVNEGFANPSTSSVWAQSTAWLFLSCLGTLKIDCIFQVFAGNPLVQ